MTQSLVWIGLFLAALACLPMAVKRFRTRNPVGAYASDAQLKFVSAVAVGQHQKVVTVEAGPQGARVSLTLGVTAQNVTCLHVAPLGPTSAQGPVDALTHAAAVL